MDAVKKKTNLFINHLENMYKNKNILITGGLGFIGSNLAIKLVEQGANVTIIDSLIPNYGGNFFNVHDIVNKVHVNISDVRDKYSMQHLIQDKDYLFNLAGQTSHLDSMTDPQTDLEINSSSQLSILEAARTSNPSIKIIFASTRQIYGKPEYLPVNEMHPINPVDVNGINKYSGESFHTLYYKIYGIKTCILRLTNCFGPRMRIKDARQTFLGIWIKNLIEGNPIKVYGDGLQLRDFNYVEDCVSALTLAGSSEQSNGKIYNLGGDKVINLLDLAKTLVDLHKGGLYELIPFPVDRKIIDIGDYYGDFSLIKKDLGWLPSVSFQNGLERTLDYFLKNYKKYT